MTSAFLLPPSVPGSPLALSSQCFRNRTGSHQLHSSPWPWPLSSHTWVMAVVSCFPACLCAIHSLPRHERGFLNRK